MCSICGYHICPSGCPNEEETPIIGKCTRCKAPIHEEYGYKNEEGEPVLCDECVENMSASDFIEYLKYEKC